MNKVREKSSNTIELERFTLRNVFALSSLNYFACVYDFHFEIPCIKLHTKKNTFALKKKKKSVLATWSEKAWK